ncbi:MAG: ComF family protein [Myxococcales bacterium]|nr:ComF family protein [Myxococcales bacterium]
MVHALLSTHVPAWRRLARGVVDLLYPDLCPWCQRVLAADEDPLACPDCAASVLRIIAPYCATCGLPVDSGEGVPACARCLEDPPAYDHLRGVVVYGGRVAAAIANLKYQRRLTSGYALAGVLYRAIDLGINWTTYDAIIPVPLFPARFRQRWFNQSLFLAAALPNAERLPLRPTWLRRVRDTVPQASLSAVERVANVKGAFAVAPGAPLAGKRLLLVDDVATTGSTLHECARVCKKAGAAAVDAVVVARAKG